MPEQITVWAEPGDSWLVLAFKHGGEHSYRLNDGRIGLRRYDQERPYDERPPLWVTVTGLDDLAGAIRRYVEDGDEDAITPFIVD